MSYCNSFGWKILIAKGFGSAPYFFYQFTLKKMFRDGDPGTFAHKNCDETERSKTSGDDAGAINENEQRYFMQTKSEIIPSAFLKHD